MADGVVAQLEGMEIPQHCQAPFIQTGQVVVGQISEDGEGGIVIKETATERKQNGDGEKFGVTSEWRLQL